VGERAANHLFRKLVVDIGKLGGEVSLKVVKSYAKDEDNKGLVSRANDVVQDVIGMAQEHFLKSRNLEPLKITELPFPDSRTSGTDGGGMAPQSNRGVTDEEATKEKEALHSPQSEPNSSLPRDKTQDQRDTGHVSGSGIPLGDKKSSETNFKTVVIK